MRLLTLFTALVAVHVAAAETVTIDTGTEQKPYTHLELKNDPNAFQFAIVTDRTGGHRPGVFMDGVRKLNLLQPEFVMSVGDLIEGYTEDRSRLDTQWKEFVSFVDQLEMPFFYVPGNHDITNGVMAEEWVKRFGRTYYHFVYRDVLFLCLNSQDPEVFSISEDQVDYMRKALAEHPDVRWTLAFLHAPMWAHSDPGNFARIEELLQGRPHTVFAGHRHHYNRDVRDSRDYITLATLGGGSALRGPNFGEFDHFMWVTMTDEGPRMANLLTSGIWDENIMNDERASLIRPALSGASVYTEGIVVDGGTFTEASTNLRLRNDSDVPMTAEIFFLQEENLRASRPMIRREVAPNTIEVVSFSVAAPTPMPPSELPPLVAEWTLKYELEGNVNPLVIASEHRIVIDTTFTAPHVAQAPVIDGGLGDWPPMAVQPKAPGYLDDTLHQWYGPVDGFFDFSVAHDGEFLYIAVDAEDDYMRLNAEDRYNEQDSIAVSIDARPSDAQDGGEAGKDWLLVALPAGADGAQLYRPEDLPEGVQAASQRDRNVYTLEIAIPIAYLNEMQGGAWQTVRVNVVQYDKDEDKGVARAYWRQPWNSPASYAGSGVFQKQ